MVERVDCVVIGAGVIGLSVARELASAGLETLLIEKSDLFGSETSSRNSEVIHGGIYYTPGSKKADFCVLFCAKHCRSSTNDRPRRSSHHAKALKN